MKDNKSLHNDYYYYNIVRINIKKHRKMANLTQQQLADKIDVSMHYISQIESANPNKYFTLVVIGRIADALNIDIKELLFIVLSGFAAGASWLCFYRALLLKSERS